MTTVDAMVARTLARMEGSIGPVEIDVLNGAINDTVTSLTSTNGVAGLRVGALIQLDYELMRITSVVGNTVSVIRGQGGTTAATHGNGALIEVQPRFTRHSLQESMKEEIDSWNESRIFQADWTTITVNPSGGVMTYEVFTTTAEVDEWVRPLEVQLRNPSATDGRYRNPKCRFRKVQTDDYGSGLAIEFLDARLPLNFTDVNIKYAKKLDTSTFDTTTDLETTCGLSAGMLPAAMYGTMGRVLVGRESRRVVRQREGQSRDPQQVREGATFQTGAAFRQMAQDTLNQEAIRLNREHPTKVRQ